MTQPTWARETRKLAELVPWEHNPRQIREADAVRLAESLDQFGQIHAIAIGPGNEVYDGHQRKNVWAACERYGPDYVVDVRVASRPLTEAERQKLVVYLHSGATGGWDWDKFSAWDTPALKGWGLDESALRGWRDDVANLTAMHEAEEEAPPEDPGAQIDRAEELREKWGVRLGQLWEIGWHLLLCGDSTDDVSALGILPTNLIYDPPWDADIDTTAFSRDWHGVIGFADGYRARDVIDLFGSPAWVFVWDCITSWYTPNRPLRRGKLALWFGDVGAYQFDGAHYGKPLDAHTVKNTRGEYQFQPDPRGKHLSDVFQMGITELHGEDGHKHEKPLDWVRLLIGDCLCGDVYDPFIGSGTTMVAAEQLGRRCVGVELEPMYVALTLQRLCDMGLAPRLADMQQDHP